MGPSKSPLTASAGGVAWMVAAVAAFWAVPELNAHTSAFIAEVIFSYTSDPQLMRWMRWGWMAILWLLVFHFVRAVLSFALSVWLMRLVEALFRK